MVLVCQCHKVGYFWELGAPYVRDGVMEWQCPLHGQSYRRGFSLCSTLLFILQQKAEEIPKSDLEPWLKFFYRIGKGFSQRPSNHGTPEKTQLTSTDWALPDLLTQGEPGYEQNWHNYCPSQAPSPLKPSSPSPAPPFPWSCWNNPGKKHLTYVLYFNVYGMAFCIIGIIAIAL